MAKRAYRTKFLGNGVDKLPRKALERIAGVYLKNDTEIVDALERIVEENDYRTAPEAVRHLLYIGASATPLDGEFRAAMRNTKAQMIQYFTIRYWSLLNELVAEFYRDHSNLDAQQFVENEVEKNRQKDQNQGGPPHA